MKIVSKVLVSTLFGGIAIGAALSCSNDPALTGADGTGQGNGAGANGGTGSGKTDSGFVFKPTDAGTVGAGSTEPSLDAKNCGLRDVSLQRQPAELLLVLDRSGSMAMAPTQVRGVASKWVQVLDALNQTIMQTQADVLWGLKMFPSPGGLGGNSSCGVSAGVEVANAVNNFGAISMTMQRTQPNGGTPTAAAVQAATAFLMSRMTPNPKYLLLATDGAPNCTNARNTNATDGPPAIAAVAAAAAAGIQTFVVGIATQSMSMAADDPNQILNQMADKGGRPRNADPKYFPVTSKDELSAALETITGQIANCTFSLGEKPPSPNDVAVYVDGGRIARNDANGWSYGANMQSVQLNGTECDKLKNGTAKSAKIVFGCPGMPIP